MRHHKDINRHCRTNTKNPNALIVCGATCASSKAEVNLRLAAKELTYHIIGLAGDCDAIEDQTKG